MDMAGHHYNARYNPMYARQSPYLNRCAYVIPVGYRKVGREPENASYLLAPLSTGIVSEIDFSRPYLNKDMDPVTGLFESKTFFGKARIESVLNEMGTRYKLMNENLRGLDYQICEADSMIDRLPPHAPGMSKDLDRTRTALEDSVRRLEQEKMREKVTAWKDISRLKSDLHDVMEQYTSAQASGAFLSDYKGGQNY